MTHETTIWTYQGQLLSTHDSDDTARLSDFIKYVPGASFVLIKTKERIVVYKVIDQIAGVMIKLDDVPRRATTCSSTHTSTDTAQAA